MMKASTAHAILLVGIFAVTVNAQCPNHCSGHGTCGMYDKCKCYFGWTDGDCSNRLCREDHAWWDAPTGSDAAHAPHAECSNRGICDRKSGDCKCFEGFTGTSCQRTVCPGNMDCSGHGTCEYLSEMSDDGYDQWDHDKIVGCKCDYGFNGDACQNEMCSRGDDPLSPTTTKAVYAISGTHSADISTGVTFDFTFYGRKASIDYDPDTAVFHKALVKGLEGIDTIKKVTVEDVVADNTNQGATFTLTIDKLGTKLFRYDGKPEEMYYEIEDPTFACDPTCDTTETITASAAGKYEHMECSKRGICDYTSGTCKCFSGFTSDACDVQSALVQ